MLTACSQELIKGLLNKWSHSNAQKLLGFGRFRIYMYLYVSISDLIYGYIDA